MTPLAPVTIRSILQQEASYLPLSLYPRHAGSIRNFKGESQIPIGIQAIMRNQDTAPNFRVIAIKNKENNISTVNREEHTRGT